LLDWSPFVAFVHRHRRFLLTTHVRPDGDGLGSMLALADVFDKLGKATELVIGSVFPPRYRFLDAAGRIKRFDEFDQRPAPDAVIILDTGTWNQLGDVGTYVKSLNVPKVVIDHHLTQDDLGALRFVDVEAEATGRLAYEAIVALKQPLSKNAADKLFVALAMDTGWFRHSNATAKTYALASNLVQAGANPEELYHHLFEENTLPRLKLTGLVLDRLQVIHGGCIAHTQLHLRDYAATGATPQDTEDLINFTRSIAGVEVGLFFMEQPRGGVKVSFRSRSVDVARVAEEFGGGGHKLASGAMVDGTLDDVRARVLAAVAEAVTDAGYMP
jgi:phosphoesterase RecJ-like protein